MTTRTEGLMRVFGAENDYPFGVWTYSTPEPLEAVLRKGYFKGWHGRLRLGDLVLCGTSQSVHPWDESKRDVRRSLLMVSSKALDGIEVRLLQDWGTPEGPPLPPAAPEAAPAAGAKAAGRQRRVPFFPMARARRPQRRRLLLALGGGASWCVR
ncbi:hypothetical protein [Benzoatithermus flavus]|uniref:Uncharacterized protein n=1 Tax=Benzoatithermus flavus TaxID=3108223 RepID=A0ABU8XPA6_9PROT